MYAGLSNRFNVGIEKEAEKSFYVMELKNPDSESILNYQVEMITNNPRPSILPFEVRRKDDTVKFYYNTTGKILFVDYLKTRRITEKEFICLLSTFTNAFNECKSLFLHEENFIIGENIVYIDPLSGKVSLAYLPIESSNSFSKDMANFILKLITVAQIVDLRENNNLLGKIVNFLNKERFSIAEFEKLLHEYKKQDAKKFGEDISVIASETFNENSANLDTGIKQVQVTQNNETNWKYIFTLVSQVIVIGIAVLSESLMKQQAIQTDTRYVLIALFVLIVDLLLFKHIILKYSNLSDIPVIGKFFERKKKHINPQPPNNNQQVITQSVDKVKEEEITAKDSVNKTTKLTEIPVEKYSLTISNEVKSKLLSNLDETILISVERMPVVFLVGEKNGLEEKFEIKKEKIIVGRNTQTVDMVISEKSIGRIHAEIIYKEREFYLVDKDSKNGTFLNGEKLIGNQEYRLQIGDKITFANLNYIFVNS